MLHDLPLPAELINHIVDSFDEEDTDVLKAFSLVSRTGLSRCRQYVHETVYVRVGDESTLERQLGRYKESPLRHLVRQLSMEANGALEESLCDDITILLNCFSAVRSILIGSHPDDLLESFASPRPRSGISLRITAINFRTDAFYRLLQSIPNLSHLELSTVNWVWDDGNWHPSVEYQSCNVVPDLQVLALFSCMHQGHFLRWLCTGNNQLALKTMSLFEGCFPPEISTALAATKRTLTTLHLCESSFPPFASTVDLSELTALTLLNLVSLDVSWSIDCLSSVPSFPSLTSIALNFRFISISDFHLEDWTKLDSALSASCPRLADLYVVAEPTEIITLGLGGIGSSISYLEPPVFHAVKTALLSQLTTVQRKLPGGISVSQYWDDDDD
ncbi:hypothetical protein NM688_g3724 [Phlebia brevispora]|uniref:Uncharacterized protein n=1 Tax=Phlebia brevispora TaxID=194682 RepID=A0ACC1T5K9_9APHY|nr:hypothetical protein NM688_g3724 [Phlebia brevispora]